MGLPYRAGASSTTATVSVPTGVQNGDVMLLSVISDGTLTTPTGWTLLKNTATPGANNTYVLRRVAASEPASYTLTFTGATVTSLAIDAWSGGDNTTPEDATTPNGTTGTVATITWPSITTVTDQAETVAIAFDDAGLTGMAVPTGYTQRTGPVGATLALDVFSKSKTPAGAEAPTGTDPQGVGSSWVAMIVALRPAASDPFPAGYYQHDSMAGDNRLNTTLRM